MKTKPSIRPTTVLLPFLAGGVLSLQAQFITIPNGSFESPTPPPGFPAFPVVDVWQKAPQPAGIPLPGGITWDQLAGVFPNPPVGAGDHIDNIHGNQAAYMFSVPGVSLFQQLGDTFTVGKSYDLTLGIFGGGGISEGSTFLMSLFYMDGANMVNIGGKTITFTAGAFATPNHFYDYSLSVGTVQAADAWAGKNIGIQLVSTFGLGDGYWDVDNVRLMAVPEPGTMALLALGAGGLLWANWRARRRQ